MHLDILTLTGTLFVLVYLVILLVLSRQDVSVDPLKSTRKQGEEQG